jgi:hypothetical protein
MTKPKAAAITAVKKAANTFFPLSVLKVICVTSTLKNEVLKKYARKLPTMIIIIATASQACGVFNLLPLVTPPFK